MFGLYIEPHGAPNDLVVPGRLASPRAAQFTWDGLGRDVISSGAVLALGSRAGRGVETS